MSGNLDSCNGPLCGTVVDITHSFAPGCDDSVQTNDRKYAVHLLSWQL